MYSRGLIAGMATTALFTFNQKRQKDLLQAQARFQPPYFVVGKTLNPKFEKRYKGGEDALVISEDHRMLSVCDGVGGWGDVGVDPGKFSKQLCASIGYLYHLNSHMSLKEILVEAVKRNKNVGSSTAVLAKLETGVEGKMSTCNLGDSGYLIFRQTGTELTKIYASDA